MGVQYYPQILSPACYVDGPTLTAAAAATCIPPSCKFTLPNNYWYVGRQWRLTASGRVSTVITTPGTIRFDLRLGAVVAFDTLAMLPDTVAAHSTVGWYLNVLLTCRTLGAGGVTSQLFPQGVFTCEDLLGVPATAPKGVLSAIVPWNSAPALGTAFDNTLQNTVDFFFTQTAATGSMTLHQYMIEELN